MLLTCYPSKKITIHIQLFNIIHFVLLVCQSPFLYKGNNIASGFKSTEQASYSKTAMLSMPPGSNTTSRNTQPITHTLRKTAAEVLQTLGSCSIILHYSVLVPGQKSLYYQSI